MKARQPLLATNAFRVFIFLLNKLQDRIPKTASKKLLDVISFYKRIEQVAQFHMYITNKYVTPAIASSSGKMSISKTELRVSGGFDQLHMSKYFA